MPPTFTQRREIESYENKLLIDIFNGKILAYVFSHLEGLKTSCKILYFETFGHFSVFCSATPIDFF